MPQNVKLELDNLLNEIRTLANINTIYLFGSYAYGNPNEDSDLDICIITDDKNTRKIDIIRKVRKAIAEVVTMPVDLIVYYNDEFVERANLNCTMEHQIAFDGVKIYG
jgi:uncharacterized protein